MTDERQNDDVEFVPELSVLWELKRVGREIQATGSDYPISLDLLISRAEALVEHLPVADEGREEE